MPRKSLEIAVLHGVEQYLICAAGFDTFAYRQPQWAKQLEIFEIDHPLSSADKQERLKKANMDTPTNLHFVKADFAMDNWVKNLENENIFDKKKRSFCSVLGLIYYLSRDDFEQYISTLSSIIPVNSSIVFDYPNEHYFYSQRKHSNLAKAANEEMHACYSYEEMKAILEKYNMQIFEHLDSEQMTSQYFSEYNSANSSYEMKAQSNVNYCLCVKK